MLKTIFVSLLMILTITSNAFAGYYTPEEEQAIAQGIENLKTEIIKLQLQVDAYKEAYEREKSINERYAETIKSVIEKLEDKIGLLETQIKLTEDKVKLLIKDNNRLTRENTFMKLITTVAIAVVIIN